MRSCGLPGRNPAGSGVGIEPGKAYIYRSKTHTKMECPKIEYNEFIGCQGVRVSDELLTEWARKAKDEGREGDSKRYTAELLRRQNEFFVLHVFGGGNNTLGGVNTIVASSHRIGVDNGFNGWDEAKKYVIDSLQSDNSHTNCLIISWSDLEYHEDQATNCYGTKYTEVGYRLKPGVFDFSTSAI
jgi:hypothetical protein